MDANPRIAIDAMGGDGGPAAMVAGLAKALRRESALRFQVFGDEKQIRPELQKISDRRDAVEIVHTSEAIAASEKPSQAIRRAKTTSMGMAIAAVKDGLADAAVSGGNTGALMTRAWFAMTRSASRPARSARSMKQRR